MIQHHLKQFSNFGLSFNFNLPKNEVPVKTESADLLDCKLPNNKNCKKKSSKNLTRTKSMNSPNMSLDSKTFNLKQTTASMSQMKTKSNKSSGTLTRAENHVLNNIRKASITGKSSEGLENIVQSKVISLNPKNKNDFLSLSEVIGNKSTISEIESSRSESQAEDLKSNKLKESIVQADSKILDNKKSSSVDRATKTVDNLDRDEISSLLIEPRVIKPILVQEGKVLYI